MSDSGLRLSRAGAVVRMELDRPQVRNAMGLDTFDAIGEAVAEVSRSEVDRVLVVAGQPGFFSAGGELPREPAQPVAHGVGLVRMQQVVGTAVQRLFSCPKPVIAEIDGYALGAGLSLVLAADLAIASTRSTFAAPFVERGLGLDGGLSWSLPRAVGLRRAKQIVFYGEPLHAEEALAIGLINEVIEPERLAQRIAERAEQLAERSPTALTLAKQALNRSSATSLADVVETEALAQVIGTRSGEVRWR
ncbi:enoyl-CoA hydratase/isomerase family protein [Nocardioides sp. Bht2]|uniref:enoyl-CoA hydratase/isomerase family protein n=1 Tax=Nocardioides sp. Bht2 TaxID=3392297 RepID=UPI0039B655B5